MRAIFEALPIVLSLVGLLASLERTFNAKRKDDRLLFLMQSLCCGLLALAQSSWFVSLLAGFNHDTAITEYTWTAFNSLVALTFTVASWTNKHR